MHVTEIIERRRKPLVSLEITPPEKGTSIVHIFDTMETLLPYSPSFVNVTYHQERIVYEEHEGVIKKIPRRKKPGTVGICSALAHRFRIETVPHLICSGFNRYETENALIDLHYLGFDNIFVIRGDPPPGFKEIPSEPEGHVYASELVAQVASLNRGEYIEQIEKGDATNFCVGVAGYPEKHYEAPNLAEDILHLKHKVDCGAAYIITQMFFSAKVFEEFRQRLIDAGVTVPIVPGMKVLTQPKQLLTIPRDFHISLPEELVESLRAAKDPADFRRRGIQWAEKLCLDLVDLNVPCLHFYTMGKAGALSEVLAKLQKKGVIP